MLHESTTVIIFFFVVVWLRVYVSSASGKSGFFFSNDPEYDYKCSGGAVRGKERNDEM